jgi:hypothetical protein
MAATVALVRTGVPGNRKAVVADLTFDNYVTGGYVLTPGTFGLATIENVLFGGSVFGSWGEYVRSTNSLKFYSAAGTEFTNAAATLSGKVATVTVEGT